jgi:hypothetical protein
MMKITSSIVDVFYKGERYRRVQTVGEFYWVPITPFPATSWGDADEKELERHYQNILPVKKEVETVYVHTEKKRDEYEPVIQHFQDESGRTAMDDYEFNLKRNWKE